jgi:23S rRNA (uracil1939-C5)-methyltransferase
MLNKKEIYTVIASDLTQDGDGVARIEDLVVFVPGLLPQEKGQIRLKKIKKSYALGELVKIIDRSPNRAEPPCFHYGDCGGCNIQHLAYSAQLDVKRNLVSQTLSRIGGIESVEVDPVIGMDNPFRYRTKIQFQVRGHELGFYAKKSKRFVKIKECLLIPGDMNELKNHVEKFLMDHSLQTSRVVIKKSMKNSNFMVLLHGKVPKSSILKRMKDSCQELPGVSSLIWIDSENHRYYHLSGDDYIEEEILGLKFRISPLAFVQVNHHQMQALYAYIIDKAALTESDEVLDLYCGMGSITCHIAKHAGDVIGIEVVHSAIRDAELNAKLNQIENTSFILGKVEEVLPTKLPRGFEPDVIFLDPPRSGVEQEALEAILAASPREIVYVSCNPATLARDLKILSESGEYSVQEVQPFDVFTQSMHVETVVLLER